MSKSVLESSESTACGDRNLAAVCLDDIVEQSIRTPYANDEFPVRIHGVVIGDLVGISELGEPLVACGDQLPAVAKTTVALDSGAIGRQVALMFENGNPESPLVIGVIQRFNDVEQEQRSDEQSQPLEVRRDDERLVLTADREIVLRCGEASITLTRAGKILIRGNYVLSRSSGVNRIKGGSVQIN